MKDYIPLKVEFCLYENILCGSVLQQDDRLINKINEDDTLEENNNHYRLSILHSPDLYDHALYLRGKDKNEDNDAFTYHYATKQDAETALKNFKELIRQVNNFYADRSTTEKTNTYCVEVCE